MHACTHLYLRHESASWMQHRGAPGLRMAKATWRLSRDQDTRLTHEPSGYPLTCPTPHSTHNIVDAWLKCMKKQADSPCIAPLCSSCSLERALCPKFRHILAPCGAPASAARRAPARQGRA